jgi:hypothetical protein
MEGYCKKDFQKRIKNRQSYKDRQPDELPEYFQPGLFP